MGTRVRRQAGNKAVWAAKEVSKWCSGNMSWGRQSKRPRRVSSGLSLEDENELFKWRNQGRAFKACTVACQLWRVPTGWLSTDGQYRHLPLQVLVLGPQSAGTIASSSGLMAAVGQLVQAASVLAQPLSDPGQASTLSGTSLFLSLKWKGRTTCPTYLLLKSGPWGSNQRMYAKEQAQSNAHRWGGVTTQTAHPILTSSCHSCDIHWGTERAGEGGGALEKIRSAKTSPRLSTPGFAMD